jgi:photosynthetic reaction center H subunit
MGTGAITQYVDVAQIVLYVFWIFFFWLVVYLTVESKREGFPLEASHTDKRLLPGILPMPKPKTYLLPHGGSVTVPNDKVSPQVLKAQEVQPWGGAPIEPTGNPMLDGVGPGAYADRADVPDQMLDGSPKIVPLAAAKGFSIPKQDRSPIGMTVYGADDEPAGPVTEVWVDQMEMMIRFLEVTTGTGDAKRQVLVPINFTRIGRNDITVRAILARHFASIPGIRTAGQITLLEEEKIMAYFGGGTLYATPDRQEPLL